MTIEKRITDQLGSDHPDLGDVQQIVGCHEVADLRFGLVVSRFNPELTEGLARAAVQALKTHGARPEQITIIWVPGAFELSGVLEICASRGQYDALIALGAVLQGATPHADAIGQTVVRSLSEIARTYQLPVIDGVVVARTAEQASARCLSGEQSRGWYAAKAAIEMAQVMKAVKS